MKKILFVFGTRPEAIKLAPLIIEARETKPDLIPSICVTSQHKALLRQVLDFFKIDPDHNLDIMKKGQSLLEVTVKGLKKLGPVLEKENPDAVIVQGDTNTTFLASLAAYYKKIKIAHVEAGLRSGDRYNPFPEEQFRRMTDTYSDWCFAPTKLASRNLLKENISRENIFITGNTGIDALFLTLKKLQTSSLNEEIKSKFINSYGLDWMEKKSILVTVHRRESFGPDLNNICQGLKELARRAPQAQIVWPLHPNPEVKNPVKSELASINNLYLIDPQNYPSFVWMMNHSHIILTDSGGIQEEAPSLGKPVLVLRKKTERPEGIQAGTAVLVGVNSEPIVTYSLELLENERAYQKMARKVNPYGDGKASSRILKILEETL